MFIKPSFNTLSACVLASCYLFSAASIAQQIPEDSMLPCDELEQEVLSQVSPDEVKRITGYKEATPLERVDPKYPKMAAQKGTEGWVLMSYVIDEEGNVQDPVVEDFEGDTGFKRAALNAVEDWKYSPAMKDGKPTQQCVSSVRFDFTMARVSGASRRFAQMYKQAREKLSSGDIEGTQALFVELRDKRASNRYENAWVSSLDASIAQEQKDDARELIAIRRTILNSQSHANGRSTFDDQFLGYLHQRMFVLEATQGSFGAALETAEEILELADGDTLMQPLQSTKKIIDDAIASDQQLILDINLKERSNYFHILTRKHFAFLDIEGKLETLEVRCDTHREKFTVAEGFMWSIPGSWGKCRVMVEGEQGTRFSLVEVNNT
jgi:TonB family protein